MPISFTVNPLDSRTFSELTISLTVKNSSRSASLARFLNPGAKGGFSGICLFVLHSHKIRLTGVELLFGNLDKLMIDFVPDRASFEILCGKCGCPAPLEGVEHGITTDAEHFDEPVRKLFEEHGKVHRPVARRLHLSAVAVNFGVMALQGASDFDISLGRYQN